MWQILRPLAFASTLFRMILEHCSSPFLATALVKLQSHKATYSYLPTSIACQPRIHQTRHGETESRRSREYPLLEEIDEVCVHSALCRLYRIPSKVRRRNRITSDTPPCSLGSSETWDATVEQISTGSLILRTSTPRNKPSNRCSAQSVTYCISLRNSGRITPKCLFNTVSHRTRQRSPGTIASRKLQDPP